MYRVREEIDEVVGDKTSVEADDLDKLTYMNQVYIKVVTLYMYFISALADHSSTELLV